jgi:hypothetical protein
MTDTVQTNEVIVTLDGRDIRIPMASLSLTMDSGVGVILDAVRPVIQSDENVDIQDSRGDYSFTVRKAVNSSTIYVYPKPVAGAEVKLRRGYYTLKNKQDSKLKVKYLAPKDCNDRKRIGQKMTISMGNKTISLNGTQMRSLVKVIGQALCL